MSNTTHAKSDVISSLKNAVINKINVESNIQDFPMNFGQRLSPDLIELVKNKMS